MKYELLSPNRQERKPRRFKTTTVSSKKLNRSTNACCRINKHKSTSVALPSFELLLSVAPRFRRKLTISLSNLLLLSVVALSLYPAQAQENISPFRTKPFPVTSPFAVKQQTPKPATTSDSESDSQGLPEQGESTDELPASDPNPLNPTGDSLDSLIQRGINADLWQQMRGGLPCVDATTECITQLQEIATQENPLLIEIDTRIEEINSKIEEAKAANKKSIDLAVLRPAARVFLEPTFPVQSNFTQRQPGTIEKIAQIFTSPVGVINEVLKAVGIPLFDKLFGGSDQNQERAIAISDLQVKLAEIQRSRAELANQVKEKIALAVFDFDTSRREFQISQEVSKREAARIQLTEAEYRLGQGDSNSYLGQLTSLDGRKAQTFRAWTSLRSQLEKIRLLVLGTQDKS